MLRVPLQKSTVKSTLSTVTVYKEKIHFREANLVFTQLDSQNEQFEDDVSVLEAALKEATDEYEKVKGDEDALKTWIESNQ